ncbi:MAG: hypothetical protein ACRYGR_08330 [Janthinobacterium lividum]
MGIEVETSSIKIKSSVPGIDFPFSLKNNKIALFCLEEDTPDRTFDNDPRYTKFGKNLEIRTIDGYNYDQINRLSSVISLILNDINQEARDKVLSIEESYLNKITGPTDYQIIPQKKKGKFEITLKDPNFTIIPTVRLQISYQLPLEEIPRVFQHLSNLKHKDIKPFVDDLDPTIGLKESNFEEYKNKINKPNPTFKDKFLFKTYRSIIKSETVAKYFKENIAQEFSALRQNKAKGLIQMFLFYWHSLFNDKEGMSNENGLKPYLGIMSRVPFSMLYDTLDEENKKDFNTFFNNRKEGLKEEAFKLRTYHPDPEAVSRITLSNWFDSIIDEDKRVYDINNYYKVDIMSPPPTPERSSNSMGALDMNSSNGHALIEVRAYSTLEPGLTFLKDLSQYKLLFEKKFNEEELSRPPELVQNSGLFQDHVKEKLEDKLSEYKELCEYVRNESNWFFKK